MTATDRLSPCLTGKLLLRLNVVDVNDNIPVLVVSDTDNTTAVQYSFTVEEEQEAGGCSGRKGLSSRKGALRAV